MVLHEDDYSVIRHDGDVSAIVIEWREATAGMTDEDFKEALTRLARFAGEHGAAHILVDVRAFRHRPGPDIEAWRQAAIIPAYASAGVTKFAYVTPEDWGSGPPSGGTPPPFETRAFTSAEDARAWFREP